ncbi:MAG: indolepyruvate oxidoreductase subunit beta [Rhodobacterales bacterium]|nr:indolepyruvate oxidoreductase subunit beta [Rhodobacterales bacterium]
MTGDVTNIMICGIGGQGVMTAAEILAQSAISLGHDAKKTEVAGMAQRGGVVTSHVRFGPKVLSPSIPAGQADLLLGFEAAEALRWCGELKPGGVAMVNTMKLVPPVVSVGLFDYPDDPIGQIRAAGVTVYAFDAGQIARDLGEVRLGNTIMLGAIADYLPFGAEVLKEQVVERFRARKPELAELNERAFEAGRKAAADASAAASSAA